MNKYPRYINILTIKIFDCEISLKLGNPMWFWYEFTHLKKFKKSIDKNK